jgi:uncharacterized protein YndB with AHSA1/START domain
MRVTPFAAAAIALVAASPTCAEVAAIGPSGFEIRNEAVIAAAPDKVFSALTRRVGRWWDSEHTYSGDARNMRIDARPGGCFCEKIPDKGAIEHLRVIYVSKNEALRLSGGLGPLQESGLAGTLTWSLKAEGQGTRLVQDYRVGGFRPDGFEQMAPLVDEVLNVQLQRLKGFVETGEPAGEAGR